MQLVDDVANSKEILIAEDFKNYAHIVSHDLGAPVRAMVEFSKLLNQECSNSLTDDGKDYLSFVIENGQKLQAMMNSLLVYSEISNTNNSLSKIDVQKIVHDFSKINNCILIYDNLPHVFGEHHLIEQVFLNVLDNAFKFHKGGNIPEVRITAIRKPGFDEFSIQDNGIGIAPQFQEVIFRPFKRLHVDNEYTGIGMGLTLAQKIIHKHGGQISCHSSLNQGSTFILRLPFKDETSE